MLPVPLPGAGADHAVEALRSAERAAANIATGGRPGIERFNAYQRWATDTVRALSLLLRPADVDRLVATPRYWALQAVDPAAHADAGSLADLELARRRVDLAAAADALAAAAARRSAHAGQLVVADTNIYLHHPQTFDRIDWPALLSTGSLGAHLVVPILVVDELDDSKRRDKTAARARHTLKLLEDLFPDPRAIALLRPEAPPVRVEIVHDPPGHRRLPHPDSELVDRACALRDLHNAPVTVVTDDTAMLFRARAAGLEGRRL